MTNRTNRMTAVLSASILVAAVAAGPVAPAPMTRAATPTEWSTYRGDAARTGVSPGEGPSRDPAERWRVQAQGGVTSEPAVVDGVVYVGSADAVIHAVDALPASQIAVTPDGGTLLVNHYAWDKVQAYSLLATLTSEGPASAVLPAPYGPAANGIVVYHSDGDIWAVDADGSGPRLLIGGAPEDTFPWFAPDGEHFVFERRQTGQPPRLMVAAADGTGIMPVADIPGEWPWSDWGADSVHFGVLWEIEGGPTLQVLTTDGSEPARTLDIGTIEPIELVGSRPPDGHELVFSGRAGPGSSDVGLFGIAPDGSGLRSIGDAFPSGDVFEDAVFSADGSTMASWNWEENAKGEVGGYLHLRDLETGAERVVSLDPAWPEVGFTPRFSPDGRWLVIESGPHGGTRDDNAQIVIAPVDGSSPARALGTPYHAQQVYALSPDGTRIIQHRDPGGTFLIDVATGTETKLADEMAYPSWQRR